MVQYPIFIICRDRVTYLSQLVDWLEKAGHERIHLMDNDSTYQPLLDYYEKSPHTVVRLGGNTGHNGLWTMGLMKEYKQEDEYFVVSDPDVIPSEDCPDDAVDYFRHILDNHDTRTKVGFGLRIDDIPDHYRFKQNVIDYETHFWHYGPGMGLHFAPIDTTFALYRPGSTQDISFSCRTGFPYVARHMSWYIDSNNVPEEEEYYIANAHPRINTWNHIALPYYLGGSR